MPFNCYGTWYPSGHNSGGSRFMMDFQQDVMLQDWLANRSEEDKERDKLEEQEDLRERNKILEIEKKKDYAMNVRLASRMRAREEIEKKRGTPWDKEKKKLDSAMRAWKEEEVSEEKQKAKDEAHSKLRLLPAKFLHSAQSKQAVEVERNSKQEQARNEKFQELATAEADRWDEELKLATVIQANSNDGELYGCHRKDCIPRNYTTGTRTTSCTDCRADEKMYARERKH
ncbi:hypothetical protein NHQ30_005860 [Ciborinia camelliae]|nr:hypothetical protein NHQ30_005860 [Ciborinia camelliae]